MSPQIHIVAMARLSPTAAGLHTLTFRYAPDGHDHALYGVHVEPKLAAVFRANDVRLFSLLSMNEQGLGRTFLAGHPNFLVGAVTTSKGTAIQALPSRLRLAKGVGIALAAFGAGLVGLFASEGQAWLAAGAAALATASAFAAWRIPSKVSPENLDLDFCSGTMLIPQSALPSDAKLACSPSTLVLADEARYDQGRQAQEQ